MSNDIAVTVSRDPAGNVLVVLNDLEGHTIAGATFPPEFWYQLKGALAAVEDQMLRRKWIEPQDYSVEDLPPEGTTAWN